MARRGSCDDGVNSPGSTCRRHSTHHYSHRRFPLRPSTCRPNSWSFCHSVRAPGTAPGPATPGHCTPRIPNPSLSALLSVDRDILARGPATVCQCAGVRVPHALAPLQQTMTPRSQPEPVDFPNRECEVKPNSHSGSGLPVRFRREILGAIALP